MSAVFKYAILLPSLSVMDAMSLQCDINSLYLKCNLRTQWSV